MTIINLRKYYYPQFKTDTFIEVSDEVAEALLTAHRYENSSHQKIFYHKAFYSLDAEDGMENSAIGWGQPSPEEIFMQKVSMEQLYQAIHALPPQQSRRVE